MAERTSTRSPASVEAGHGHPLHEASGLYWCALTTASRAPGSDAGPVRPPDAPRDRPAPASHGQTRGWHAPRRWPRIRRPRPWIAVGAIGIAVLAVLAATSWLGIRKDDAPVAEVAAVAAPARATHAEGR